MGKAAKFKKLRRLASQLPPIETRRVLGERVKGIEVKEGELKEGEKINPELSNMRKKLIQVPLNHNRNLKKAYMKAGMKGASIYANAVIQYTKNKTAAATESASKQ